MVLTKTEGTQRLEKFVLETSVKHRNIAIKVNTIILKSIGTLILLILLRRCIGSLSGQINGLL